MADRCRLEGGGWRIDADPGAADGGSMRTQGRLMGMILSFSLKRSQKSGFYARPPLFSKSSQDFILSPFDLSH